MKKLALKQRLARAQELARDIGPRDPDFDLKSFSDALWDNDFARTDRGGHAIT